MQHNLETNATHKTEFNANDPEVRTNQEKPFGLSSCSGTKKSQHLQTRRKKNCAMEKTAFLSKTMSNVDGFRFAQISPCQNAMKQVPSKFQWEMKNKTFVEAFPNRSDLCQSCHIWLRIKALQLLIRISHSVCMWPAQCLNSSLL